MVYLNQYEEAYEDAKKQADRLIKKIKIYNSEIAKIEDVKRELDILKGKIKCDELYIAKLEEDKRRLNKENLKLLHELEELKKENAE